jgi:hypothetical protein
VHFGKFACLSKRREASGFVLCFFPDFEEKPETSKQHFSIFFGHLQSKETNTIFQQANSSFRPNFRVKQRSGSSMHCDKSTCESGAAAASMHGHSLNR